MSDQGGSGMSGDAIAGGDCNTELETAVLLDAVIHDIRTPLSAMSGWLEVLEAQLGDADGLTGRALKGLRRSVDGQTAVLATLSDTLGKQRHNLPPDGDCLLLERMQTALALLEANRDRSGAAIETARLDALRHFSAVGSLNCADAGQSLNDACVVLLHALAVAQAGTDEPVTVTAAADRIRIRVPGATGDPSPLRGLCQGFAGYSTRRPDIRVQSLWLARSMLQRCGLILTMSAIDGSGFQLEMTRRPSN